MFKSVLKIVFTIAIIAILLFVMANFLNQLWSRKQIYKATSTVTKFPGTGEITKFESAKILVDPILGGVPFYDIPQNRYLYTGTEGGYNIYDIPEQESILYAVGRFQGWERVEGSPDQYMLVKYPNSEIIKKYRVAFEKSDLFKSESTALHVENINILNFLSPSSQFAISTNSDFVDTGFKDSEKIFDKNDTVIIIPVFDPPKANGIDQSGYILAYQIIIRRAFGKI